MAADEARVALLLALRGAGLRDLDVLRAVATIPREAFLPEHLRHFGSRNVAVPLACGQTMPPPLTLALMLEALDLRPDHRVFEVGTGSGYSAALLARIAGEVVTFERYRTLAEGAQARRDGLGVAARVIFGYGLAPPPDLGRFDRILVHGAIPAAPPGLAGALAPGGRIVAGVPAGEDGPASIAVFERADGGFTCRRLAPIRLAPIQTGIARSL